MTTKRVMWKQLMGLEGYQVRVYKDKKSWGYCLTVKYHPLAGGSKPWKGWNRRQALAVQKKLRAEGIPATLSFLLNGKFATCVAFDVKQDEKTVALNKLTEKERKLLGL